MSKMNKKMTRKKEEDNQEVTKGPEDQSAFPTQEARRPKQFFDEPSPQPIFGDQVAPGGGGQQVDTAIQQLQLLQFNPGTQAVASQAVPPQQFPGQTVASQQIPSQAGVPQQFSQQPPSFPTSGQAQQFLGSRQFDQQPPSFPTS